jgi:hypothetical protein
VGFLQTINRHDRLRYEQRNGPNSVVRWVVFLILMATSARAQPAYTIAPGSIPCVGPSGAVGFACNAGGGPSSPIGPPGPRILFTTLAGGTVGGSPVAGSGTYTLATPTGLTNAIWGGGCSGASTVAGFSAAAGSWSATFTVPLAGGSACTITVNGTGPNTATATSPGVTIAAGACSNQLDFSVACNSQYLTVLK